MTKYYTTQSTKARKFLNEPENRYGNREDIDIRRNQSERSAFQSIRYPNDIVLLDDTDVGL